MQDFTFNSVFALLMFESLTSIIYDSGKVVHHFICRARLLFTVLCALSKTAEFRFGEVHESWFLYARLTFLLVP